MNRHVIITAGGVGKRMGSLLPKQCIRLNGLPILQHTINRFRDVCPGINTIVTLPLDHITTWKNICEELNIKIDYEIAVGGKERFYSIRNGLRFITDDGIVGIHDAVRPFVSSETIERCYMAAEISGAAVPAIEIQESIRKISEIGSEHVNRHDYRIVQTPQCFDINIIKKAYQSDFDPAFTDDASVVEASGVSIKLVDGNNENIKITYQNDLVFAETLLTE